MNTDRGDLRRTAFMDPAFAGITMGPRRLPTQNRLLIVSA
jgi:hypothetical protein